MLRETFDAHARRIFGTQLRHPIFYVCPYALRFELDPQGRVDLPVALARAMEIYQRLPGRPTLLRIDALVWPEKAHRLRHQLDVLFRQCRIAGPRQATLEWVPVSDCEMWTYHSLYVRLDDRFRPEPLLREIVSEDFSPELSPCEVFLLDEAHDVLYHPYDDRGADVAAADRETLRPLYQELNPWLLDYDRARMDAMFNET